MPSMQSIQPELSGNAPPGAALRLGSDVYGLRPGRAHELDCAFEQKGKG
jgi:hypothetical protein